MVEAIKANNQGMEGDEEMSIWDKIKRWFVALGKLLFDFTKTTVAKFIDAWNGRREESLGGGPDDGPGPWG